MTPEEMEFLFFEYNPETQGDNLEKNNQLIVEVCKQ